MSKETQPIQEGLFGAAKQFSDAFFDGLKNNAVDKVLAKARKARLHQDAIDKMEDIRREKQQLDKILRGITIDKK
jgi:F420-dependent methylenetetrahydromethanopterin dehydrogenase